MKKKEREAVRQRLLQLGSRGKLTPNKVVADAKHSRSPLHRCFDWDDTSAAHKHRLWQARELIAKVKVCIEQRDTEIAVLAYVRDPAVGSRTQGYRSTAHLKDDQERAYEVLVAETSRAAAYLQRVRSLAVALDLEQEVDSIIYSFEVFQQIIMQKQRRVA